MNFAAFIQRKKNIIRARHEGELYLMEGPRAVEVRSTETIFAELDGLKGLNVAERGKVNARRRAFC